METLVVLLKDVIEENLARTDTAYSGPDKSLVGKLAKSIEKDGLLHLPVVRPAMDKPGKYSIVCGRKRVAALRQLGRESTEVRVFPEMDLTAAHYAAIAENMFRSKIVTKRAMAALRDWHDFYYVQNPTAEPSAARSTKAKKQHAARKKAAAEAASGGKQAADGEAAATHEAGANGEAGAETTEATSADEGPDSPQRFASVVAEATGVSERTADRNIQIARAINDEQAGILEAVGVTQNDLELLSRVKDNTQRATAINLVASGQSVSAAISAVGVKKPDPFGDSLTVKEWAEKYCPEIMARLRSNEDPFLASADIYRTTRKARQTFASAVRDEVKKSTAANKRPGVLVRLLTQIVGLSHPKDWLVCATCQGSGANGATPICPKCAGDGFKHKWEPIS